MAARPLSAFSLMPFRVGASSRAREGRKLCDASTPWPAQTSLFRARVIGRPLYHVTLQHYSERVTPNIPQDFSFAFLGVDERKIRHVARETRYLLCNLRKVEAIPPFLEFWWHMEGLQINRFSRGRGGGERDSTKPYKIHPSGCKRRMGGRRLGLTSLWIFSFFLFFFFFRHEIILTADGCRS